jgi:hypothetical protein
MILRRKSALALFMVLSRSWPSRVSAIRFRRLRRLRRFRVEPNLKGKRHRVFAGGIAQLLSDGETARWELPRAALGVVWCERVVSLYQKRAGDARSACMGAEEPMGRGASVSRRSGETGRTDCGLANTQGVPECGVRNAE